MTIEDVYIERDILERNIKELIQSFEKKTMLEINSVSIDRLDMSTTEDDRSILHRVRVFINFPY